MSRIAYVLTDVPMYYAFDGLDDIVKQEKRKNAEFKRYVEAGGLILFLNKPLTRCKLYSENGQVIGYLKVKAGRLTEESIDLIPKTFGGSLTRSDAVKRALKEVFKKVPGPGKIEKTVLLA